MPLIRLRNESVYSISCQNGTEMGAQMDQKIRRGPARAPPSSKKRSRHPAGPGPAQKKKKSTLRRARIAKKKEVDTPGPGASPGGKKKEVGTPACRGPWTGPRFGPKMKTCTAFLNKMGRKWVPRWTKKDVVAPPGPSPAPKKRSRHSAGPGPAKKRSRCSAGPGPPNKKKSMLAAGRPGPDPYRLLFYLSEG